MKKIVIILLALLALLAFAACQQEDGECQHKELADTKYEPTCSLEGYVLHVCRDCGHTYKSDFVQPLGHTFTKTVAEPTCTAEGKTHYACACGYEYDTDFIAPTGHSYASTITEPTCTEAGHTTYTCAVCFYEHKANWVVPNGHSLTSARVEPTCDAAGYTQYTCGNCDYAYRTAFETPAHTFTKTTYYPTIGKTGYTEHTCGVCAYSYQTDFVWYSDVFAGAAGEGKGVLARGVDLSYHNQDVDFAALKAAGVDYVILRAGGRSGKDVMFETNYAAARKAGLDIGCYYYSYARTVEEALAEAARFKEYIAGKQFEYPVYFDIEDDSQKELDKSLLMEICFAFCNSMIEGGYFPGVYCNLNWAENILHTEQLVKYYDVWIARYNNALPETYYHKDYGMWQYTETGKIEGVEENVDLNYCYKDYPTLIKANGLNGFQK